jgi:hypothetical protein
LHWFWFDDLLLAPATLCVQPATTTTAITAAIQLTEPRIFFQYQ